MLNYAEKLDIMPIYVKRKKEAGRIVHSGKALHIK